MLARATSSRLRILEENGEPVVGRAWSKGRRWEVAYRSPISVSTQDEAEVLLMAELLHEKEEGKRLLKEKRRRRAANKLAYQLGHKK